MYTAYSVDYVQYQIHMCKSSQPTPSKIDFSFACLLATESGLLYKYQLGKYKKNQIDQDGNTY